MARIAGVDLPRNKHVEYRAHIHLRHRELAPGRILDEAKVDR